MAFQALMLRRSNGRLELQKVFLARSDGRAKDMQLVVYEMHCARTP